MIKVLLSNKLFKFLYGLVLLPLCYVFLRTLMFVMSNIEFNDKLVQLFFTGAGAYIVVHFTLYKPIRIYIIGHELVHMISTYLCGGKVKKIKLGSSYGTVNVDKVNAFIALSPYFVPFYSIVVVIIWCILRYVFKIAISTNILSFSLGFTLMFHFVLTLYAIYLGQQDFKVAGWLFSIVVIIIMNCIVLILLFLSMFPSKIGIKEVQKFFFNFTQQTYIFCYTQIIGFVRLLQHKLIQR